VLEDEAGLRAAYREHGAPLFRFALRSLNDRGLAEEAVQETFFRAWRARERYEPLIGSLRTWLFAIARNVVVDMARARKARPVFSAELPESAIQTEDPAEGILRSTQVEEALRRISDEHRRVIVEIHLRRRTSNEVAAEIGLPDGKVRSRLFYGLKALRAALDEVGWVDDN
jgi:RNA polymerase sigma-70 factor, ECF subfamily